MPVTRGVSAIHDKGVSLQMTRMDKSLESTRDSFATVRTGRATPSMLDRIQVSSSPMLITLALLHFQKLYSRDSHRDFILASR